MGFDVTNFAGEVPAEFLCPNCHSVVFEPLLTECSHVFCSKCFRKVLKRKKGCPACGMGLRQSSGCLNREWKTNYESLMIKCTKGCDKYVSLGDMDNHLEKFCPLSFVLCTNNGCTRKIRRRDVPGHLIHCDYRMVECEGCGFETRYVNLRMHQIVRQCIRQKNLHAIVQNKRALDERVRRHRLQLQEESFKRELEDRVVEKAKMWDAIARQRPCRVFSAPASTNKTLALTSNRHAFNVSKMAQSAPDQNIVVSSPQKLVSGSGILCSNCNRLFMAELNHERACKWHKGASNFCVYV